ncbi:hypothetical protein RugamoR64_48230 [Duganella rhizosphaerae]|uniref:hypothetical protein n=1 Tax=Duganella rhizosphaerae TaxID=2885763 RepID=UPI0030E88CCC
MLAEMLALEARLTAFVCACDITCSGGLTRDCVIIDGLSIPAAGVATAGLTCCAAPAETSSTLITKEMKRK